MGICSKYGTDKDIPLVVIDYVIFFYMKNSIAFYMTSSLILNNSSWNFE